MTIFFTNPDLASMQEHLNYKNIDKMKALLIELPNSKITWWTRRLSTHSVTVNVAPKDISCIIWILYQQYDS